MLQAGGFRNIEYYFMIQLLQFTHILTAMCTQAGTVLKVNQELARTQQSSRYTSVTPGNRAMIRQ